MVMLGIIEAYVGTLPDDVAELHEILYDVMILTERLNSMSKMSMLLLMLRTRTKSETP